MISLAWIGRELWYSMYTQGATPPKEARRVPPSFRNTFKNEALESSVLKPRAPCRTSGDDSPAPIVTAWCVAAVSAWISTISV